MKKLALAAALSVVATGAFAGGYVEPAVVIEPEVIVTETSSSAGGILVPAIAVLLLVLALHHN